MTTTGDTPFSGSKSSSGSTTPTSARKKTPPAANNPSARPPSSAAAQHKDDPGTLEHSRTGALWVGIIVALLALILVLVFVVQNPQDVQMQFLGLSGELPLGVALLFAVIVGGLAITLVGSLRILQLRRTAKGQSKASSDT